MTFRKMSTAEIRERIIEEGYVREKRRPVLLDLLFYAICALVNVFFVYGLRNLIRLFYKAYLKKGLSPTDFDFEVVWPVIVAVLVVFVLGILLKWCTAFFTGRSTFCVVMPSKTLSVYSDTPLTKGKKILATAFSPVVISAALILILTLQKFPKNYLLAALYTTAAFACVTTDQIITVLLFPKAAKMKECNGILYAKAEAVFMPEEEQKA